MTSAVLTLIEQTTQVADRTLEAGDLLLAFTGSSVGDDHDIYYYDVSLDSTTVLLDGTDLGIDGVSNGIDALELIERSADVGDESLPGGRILFSLEEADAAIGGNILAATQHDIYAWDVQTTGVGSSNAQAELIFDGSDLGLAGASEDLDAFTFASAATALAGEITVDTTSDVLDGNTSSIQDLILSPGADGFISLKEAITAANNTTNGATPDIIRFDIAGAGPHTINLTSALPSITDAVIIDGWSEPDWSSAPIIEINGTGAGAADGFVFSNAGADGSTLRGMVINNFAQSGVFISNADNITVAGSYIGTDTTGAIDAGNGGHGVVIANGSTGAMIGGDTPADRNVISREHPERCRHRRRHNHRQHRRGKSHRPQRRRYRRPRQYAFRHRHRPGH